MQIKNGLLSCRGCRLKSASENTLPTEPAIPSRPGVRTPSEATLEWIERQNILLETATADEILAWAVETFSPRFTMATGLGPEGCVIISMLARIDPRVYVFNLDTGYQFRETLELPCVSPRSMA